MLDDALAQRRSQNLRRKRTEVRSVAPSIRSFAQAIDRQRTSVERVPVVRAARPGLAAVLGALDEAEAAAVAVYLDDPEVEVAGAAQAIRDLAIPVLRADLLLEEFEVYESRALGADAVLLHAAVLEGPLLQRLCDAARSTHMAAVVVCSTPADVERAAAARAPVVALIAGARGAIAASLLAAVPRRTGIVAVGPGLGAVADSVDAGTLVGRADALLDGALGAAADPAAELRRLLEAEGAP